MTKNPGLQIYQHKKTKDVVIMNFAPDRRYGGRLSWGPLVRVSTSEMRDKGINIVLENLTGFDSRDATQGCEFTQMSKREQARLNQEHIVVGVRQEHPSQLILTPLHPERGGFVGHRTEELIIDLPCSPEQFASILTSAFEKAGVHGRS